LLHDGNFPRSIRHCLDEAESCLGNLPLHGDMLRRVRAARQYLDDIKPLELDGPGLHQGLDALQIGISTIHEGIRKTWFTHLHHAENPDSPDLMRQVAGQTPPA
ncbi:MAG: alpha-E domain-containing protein, partial [Chromatiaceae bacterium]|nr:alpha-E domain-containing protein [Chromatiaceae bacterium]